MAPSLMRKLNLRLRNSKGPGEKVNRHFTINWRWDTTSLEKEMQIGKPIYIYSYILKYHNYITCILRHFEATPQHFQVVKGHSKCHDDFK